MSTHLEQLDALDQAIVAANNRVREVRGKAQHATAEAERLKQALTEAYAEGATRAATKLSAEKAEADAHAAQDWAERIAGAELAATRKKTQRDGFVVTNIAALLAAIKPDADAAAVALRTKAAELDTARHQWHAVSQHVARLLGVVPGIDARSLPMLDAIDTLIRDLSTAVAQVPPPLPQALATIAIPAHDDPDDDVREPARARVIAEGART